MQATADLRIETTERVATLAVAQLALDSPRDRVSLGAFHFKPAVVCNVFVVNAYVLKYVVYVFVFNVIVGRTDPFTLIQPS